MDLRDSSPGLEEGEILDDESNDSETEYAFNKSFAPSLNENHGHGSSKDDEKELDQIIHEFQEEYTSKNFEETSEVLSLEEEQALRLTLIAETRKKKKKQANNIQDIVAETYHNTSTPCCSRESEEHLIHDGLRQKVPEKVEETGCNRPKSKSSWVPLIKQKARNRKASLICQDSIPIKVTVFNDIHKGCHDFSSRALEVKAFPSSDVSPLHNIQSFKSVNQNIMPSSVLPQTNQFDAALHDIRIKIESKHFGEKLSNSCQIDYDNYDQIGMEIADSDKESHSRPQSSNLFPIIVESKEQPTSIEQSVVPENDDEAEALRAALLAQVKRHRNAVTAEKAHLEEGEIVGDVSDNNVATGELNTVPSSSDRNSSDLVSGIEAKDEVQKNKIKASEKQGKSRTEKANSADLRSYRRKRRYGRHSQSSEGTREGASVDIGESSPKKRKFDHHGRRRSHGGDEFPDSNSCPKSLDEWDILIEKEMKDRRTTERKIKKAEWQREENIHRRDQYLEKAGILSHSIGVLDGELMKYESSLERIKARIMMFQREREKALRDLKKCNQKEKKKDEKVPKNITNDGPFSDRVSEVFDTAFLKNTDQQDSQEIENTTLLSGNFPFSLTYSAQEDYNCHNLHNDERSNVGEPVGEKAEVEEYLSSSGTASPFCENLEDTTIQLSDFEKDSREVTPAEPMPLSKIPTTSSELDNKENIIDFEGRARQNLGGKTFCFFHARSTFSDDSVRELKDNPLIMFSGYRLCRSFPLSLITHPAISNKLDPLRPLCYYQLCGKCVDGMCQWQHESDYVMSDEEVVCSVLAHCPSLCPPDKMFSDYAREILMLQSSSPVSDVVEELLSRLPETDRTISACEMAAKCDIPREDSDEDCLVDYEILPCFTSLVLGESWL